MQYETIEHIHRTRVGKLSDKWASYLTYYDEIFRPFREENISLLEIGVQNGGSLETWCTYFKNAKFIVGCDIDPKCGRLQYQDPRVSVVVGDVNAAQTFLAIQDVCRNFDIIIDDGSHESIDILNTFINFFPLIKPGGVYVVEDTHTLYHDAVGSGILNEFGAYAFFKKLIDVINFQFWREELSVQTFFSTFFLRKQIPSFLLEGWIESISFRNSIVTITKALVPGHDKLGERLLVGRSADVQTFGGAYGTVELSKDTPSPT